MKKIFVLTISCLITMASFCFSLDESFQSEIRVQLPTTRALSPIYTSKFAAEDSLLNGDYLDQLYDIFQFDFNHNGTTVIAPACAEKDMVLKNKNLKAAFNPTAWKDFGIKHVLKGSVTGKTLSIMVFSTETGSLKHFNDIHLSGKLNEDRRHIHTLSDSVHKALFDKEGIASTQILYSAQAKPSRSENNENWVSEIWECDWDGANARQITKENSYCVTPVCIPSRHDRFLYVSYKQGQPKIFIASNEEGKGERFIDLRGNQLLPAISPRRDKIAFICDAAGRSDLFVQSLNFDRTNGTKPVQLYSFPRSTQASPTFSPDGSKIAFVSDKDGSPRIYTIHAKQGSKREDPVLITKQNSESSCPSWSPDGTKLAYSAKTKGIRQIWIYDFESQEETQLTYGPGNKENPCWAQNSLHLVFNSTDTSSSELYVVNINQPDAIKITRGSGKKHYPAWSAR
ncbi:MAG TPA: Tol-Pal system protein TolB [Rhabdochlamydiaceae bacterium]|nr:Tol-Pal system protein TolB [Rhabdochlamydiaceae bacterium]